jgi:uncharacterized membrane protein
MIKNLDFEIEERIVILIILIIIFVLASGVIISNAIVQKRTQNLIKNFQVFVVIFFMILLDDIMSVFIGIADDSNDPSRYGKILVLVLVLVQVQGFDAYFFDFINCFEIDEGNEGNE